jgi:pyruvate, water dikinase
VVGLTREKPMAVQNYIRWFGQIGLPDVPIVGGKTASLGELYSVLAPQGIPVPEGFAVTAAAYREALNAAGAWEELRRVMNFDYRDLIVLADRAAKAREIAYKATAIGGLQEQICAAYSALESKCGKDVAVAVRSSSVRGLPPLLRLDLHRPGDRVSHRQRF